VAISDSQRDMAISAAAGRVANYSNIDAATEDGCASVSEYDRPTTEIPHPKRGRRPRENRDINTETSWHGSRKEDSDSSINMTSMEMAKIMTGWWDKCHTVNHDHAFKELGYNAVARNINRRAFSSLYVTVAEDCFSYRAYSPIEVFKFKMPFDGSVVEYKRRDGHPGKCRGRVESVRMHEVNIHMEWGNPKGGENHQSIRYDSSSSELIMINRIRLFSPARKNGPTECTYSIIFTRSERGIDENGTGVLGEEEGRVHR